MSNKQIGQMVAEGILRGKDFVQSLEAVADMDVQGAGKMSCRGKKKSKMSCSGKKKGWGGKKKR